MPPCVSRMSLQPLLVRHDVVDRQPDELDVASLELRLQQRDLAQLGGADRREVARMREQQAPAGAEPLVKADPAARGFRGEVRCGDRRVARSSRSPDVSSAAAFFYGRAEKVGRAEVIVRLRTAHDRFLTAARLTP